MHPESQGLQNYGKEEKNEVHARPEINQISQTHPTGQLMPGYMSKGVASCQSGVDLSYQLSRKNEWKNNCSKQMGFN